MLGLIVVSHVVGGMVLGVPLGFLELVLPPGSPSLSSLLSEMVSLSPEPVGSIS
jgi:glycopeptide antibiotics resistance protein